jgi:uncharacterized protein (DUF433 family)
MNRMSQRIDDTRLKVVHLIEAWKAGADTVEKLQASYPYLTLAQIHAALAFYYDHQERIDAEIRENLREFHASRAETTETRAGRKLREQGLRP